MGGADGFRRMTGFKQSEFDEFYEETHWAAVLTDNVAIPLLPRPLFLALARNNPGEYSAAGNKQRHHQGSLGQPRSSAVLAPDAKEGPTIRRHVCNVRAFERDASQRLQGHARGCPEHAVPLPGQFFFTPMALLEPHSRFGQVNSNSKSFVLQTGV